MHTEYHRGADLVRSMTVFNSVLMKLRVPADWPGHESWQRMLPDIGSWLISHSTAATSVFIY